MAFNANSPALLLLGRLGASGLALLSAPIVARSIGPEGRGETAAAIALFALIPVFLGLGLPFEIRRLVAHDGHTSSIRSARRLVAWTTLIAVPVALICSFTIFGSFDTDARLAATVGVGLTPLTLCWICDVNALVARRDFLGIVALQLLQPLTYLIAVLALWLLDAATTGSVIWGYVGSNFISFSFGLWRIRSPQRGLSLPPRTLMKGSLRFAGGSLAETASNRLDQVIALPVLGAAQAGFYSVAVTVGLAPLAIAQAIGAAAFSDIVQSEGPRRLRLINESIRQVSSLSFVSSLLLSLLGPFLVVLLFGEAFDGAESAIRVVALACMLASISLQASSILVALGKGTKLAISQAVSLGVGIGLLLILGPISGALGAATASLIGFATLAILSVAMSGASATSVVPTPAAFRAGLKLLLRTK